MFANPPEKLCKKSDSVRNPCLDMAPQVLATYFITIYGWPSQLWNRKRKFEQNLLTVARAKPGADTLWFIHFLIHGARKMFIANDTDADLLYTDPMQHLQRHAVAVHAC